MTKRPFSVDDGLKLRFVRSAGFVGDGRHGYYTLTEVVDDEDRQSLWLFELAGEGTRRLAASLGDVSGPEPSPDGSKLALLAKVEDKQQIHLVPVDGGEPGRPTAPRSRSLRGPPSRATGRFRTGSTGRRTASTDWGTSTTPSPTCTWSTWRAAKCAS
jgi:dipeptidyl aminopeptidase/acylaminoacyl peptidase